MPRRLRQLDRTSSDQQFDTGCDLKKVFKLGCLSVVVLFILLMVIGALVGGDETRNSKGSVASLPRSSESSSARSSQEEAIEEEVVFKIGDRVTLGDYAYTVHRYYSATTIGDPNWGGESAGAGAVFIVIDYTIENLTSESQMVLSNDFKLIDSKERKFSSSSDATTALLMEEDQDMFMSELQPGLPLRTKTAFKVPTDAGGGKLRLLIPEKGFFSSGEAVVELN